MQCFFLPSEKKLSFAFIFQTIEMIEKEQREVERRPITKITHKGEIEIESQEPVKAPEPEEVNILHYNQSSMWKRVRVYLNTQPTPSIC